VAVGELLGRVLRKLGLRRTDPAEATTGELGRLGERAAERHLRGLGFAVLGRNLRVPMGEADLLCRDPDRRTVVIVEVKTRLRRADAPELSLTIAPEASITARKRRKLRQIARHLQRANRWEKVRIDVVGVEFDDAGGDPVIRHHAGAVALR
jgi:Predicted endonuclease distantly related to archaeal Holliday junction resolvase